MYFLKYISAVQRQRIEGIQILYDGLKTAANSQILTDVYHYAVPKRECNDMLYCESWLSTLDGF